MLTVVELHIRRKKHVFLKANVRKLPICNLMTEKKGWTAVDALNFSEGTAFENTGRCRYSPYRSRH
jgi:hypothetical protein